MSTNVINTEAANDASALLERARQRAQLFGVPFSGLIYPSEAWVLLREGRALLIDVRTAEERRFVGRVPETPHIPWKSGPDMVQNPGFVQDVEGVAHKDDVILLLCRSGVRSASAAEALVQAGFANAFNVLEGFEGELDNHQQRGTYNGWRYAGLPWIQD